MFVLFKQIFTNLAYIYCILLQIRLHSVLDELRNVVGDQFSEEDLIQTVLKHRYDFEASLNAILNHRTMNSSATTGYEQTSAQGLQQPLATKPRNSTQSG